MTYLLFGLVPEDDSNPLKLIPQAEPLFVGDRTETDPTKLPEIVKIRAVLTDSFGEEIAIEKPVKVTKKPDTKWEELVNDQLSSDPSDTPTASTW